jgi:hypothetical protein
MRIGTLGGPQILGVGWLENRSSGISSARRGAIDQRGEFDRGLVNRD